MSRRIFAAPQRLLSVAIVGFALPAAAEVRQVDTSELARCAAISGGNERLACYDALAVVAVPGIRIAPATVAAPGGDAAAPAAGPTAAAAGTTAAGTAPARTSTAVAATAGAAAASDAAARGFVATAAAPATQPDARSRAAGQAAPAARSADPDDPSNFGLTRQQLKAAPAGPASIKATVSQITEDRLSHVYLVLDNGQTWGFTEPDPRVRPGDSVTIKRAALGSFLMLTPSRRSYRVERLN
jgi:hypothetical protein